MTDAVFVDTNVFVYMRDTSDPTRQARANDWVAFLWQTRRGRVSVQILQEFYVAVTHKLKPGMPREQARLVVRALASWRPLAIDASMLDRAWTVQDRYGLSFWDALVVAAARAAGCRYLLTEDLQPDQQMDGVTVVNPFLREAGSLA